MLKCLKVNFFVKSTFFLKNVKISNNHFLGWLEDEPDMIPDEDAIKPDDWDEEMDGEWEAPLVPNPLCQSAPGCGKWRKPMIDNPLLWLSFTDKSRRPVLIFFQNIVIVLAFLYSIAHILVVHSI